MAFTRAGLHTYLLSSGAGVIPHGAHDIGMEATCLANNGDIVPGWP